MRNPALRICLAAVLAAGLAFAACACAGPPDIVGSWRAAETAGRPANLSDLTLTADGHFRYSGLNALGRPVTFGGTYKTYMNGGAPQVELFFDDYPGRPTVWFYKLEGSNLSVSAAQGNLTNGQALVFTRR